MCTGEDCPLRDSCRRFLAEPNPFRQSYFAVPPVKDGECEDHWPVEARKDSHEPAA